MYRTFSLCITLLFSSILFSQTVSQKEVIQSGPMLGHATMRDVVVWVQTKFEADVKLIYWNINKPDTKHYSQSAKTIHSKAYTAHLLADSLEPGNTYGYSISINNQEVEPIEEQTFKSLPLWQYRTDPPTFEFAVGSCTYVNEEKYDRPGTPYGRNYQIFKTINDSAPDMMLWMGDNIYLREVDYYSRTGIYKRYTHTRSLPEMQALLAKTNNYAIWDDHDFGPNDADRSYTGKTWTLEAFKDFWANPTYGFDGEGTTSQFVWNDVQFFLLDNRYWRSPNDRLTGQRQILGEEQIEWLIDALKYSKATFKFVCIGGQVLNTADLYENYMRFPEERAYLLNRIIDEEIDNVIFLSGDRHKSELSVLEDGGITIWDLTVSPLTSKSYNSVDEGNSLRVEGSHFATQNFGLLKVSGKLKERLLTIRLIDADGNLLYTYEIPELVRKK